MSKPVRDASSTSVNPFRDAESPQDGSADSDITGEEKPALRDTAAFQFVQQLARDLTRGEIDLPPFPDTALKVQECVRDPDSDIAQLASIVATEPALAAKLMRMANSVLMRRGPLEVTDLHTAISRVGMKMVQNAAIAYAAREAFKPPAGSASLQELEALRLESVRIGALSYVLAQHVHAIDKPDEAMLAGLLHAVGRFYIIMRAANHPELFTDRAALVSLIAQWHAGIARAMVEAWEFPESMAVAVGEWEVEERDRLQTADISDLLFVANLLIRENVAPEDIGSPDALARMRLSSERLKKIVDDNAEAIHSMVEAMIH